jgi:hypothetical protein
MKYVVRTFLGMGLFAFCWATIAYSIYQLLQVGTCASGGPYVIAQECPGGIGWVLFTLIGSFFLIFAAIPIYVSRGTPPGSDRAPSNGGIVIWFWTGIFWSLAVGCFLGVWGPDANPGPGGELGGLIVGFMGLVMGAGGLLALKFPEISGKAPKRPRPPDQVRPARTKVAQAASRFAGGAHSLDRLEQLDSLRARGALTDAEFETLKRRIVEGRDR